MFRYAKLSDILKDILSHGKQLKTALYEKVPHSKSLSTAASYSLLSLVLNNLQQFATAADQIESISKTVISNRFLMYVMMAEYLNMGKIIGGGKIKRLIVKFHHILPKLEKQSKINRNIVQVRLRKVSSGYSAAKVQLQKIKGVQCSPIVQDLYQLKYQQYSELTKNQSVNLLFSDACVVQSFSSALPATLLMRGVSKIFKDRMFDIIDACAAPGNKTTQLSEHIRSNGIVFAFEKNQKRYQLLCETTRKYNLANVRAFHDDFLKSDPDCKEMRRVKFILLDPSCSGSGMLVNFSRDSSNHDPADKSDQDFEEFCTNKQKQLSSFQRDRLSKLQQFQLSLLNHAVRFSPLRISYSTCSIYRTQNEDVIEQFLAYNSDYRIKSYRLGHNSNIHRGFGSTCSSCIRVDPRRLQTDGFFVCVLTKNKEKSQKTL